MAERKGHGDAANARRRELYLKGRINGLSPRDAGHLYSEEQAKARVAAISERAPKVKTRAMPTLAKRQAAQMRSGLEPSAVLPFDREHVRVRVDFAVTDIRTGRKTREHAYVTVAQSKEKRASLKTIADRTRLFLAENEDCYPDTIRKLRGISPMSRDEYAEFGEDGG
jgi:hypothetical protein